jgi:FkbM family methyltransferase
MISAAGLADIRTSMSRRWHKLLNAVVPTPIKIALKGAVATSIPSLRHLDMKSRLRHLGSLGYSPRVIYDIGGAQGEWATMVHGIWPGAKIVAFEPNASRVPLLEATRTRIPGYTFHRCFLGPKRGTVTYADAADQTSLMDPQQNAGGTASAEMRVLDEMIAEGTIPPPDFMKLDVQGYELEVLKGGSQAMQAASGVMLEVSFGRFGPEMPIYSDILAFLHERGFGWYDVAGIYRRPEDDALFQLDMIFLKRDHQLMAAHKL